MFLEAQVNLEKTNTNVASAKEKLFHYEKKGGFAIQHGNLVLVALDKSH
jgi:hypothetical protein